MKNFQHLLSLLVAIATGWVTSASTESDVLSVSFNKFEKVLDGPGRVYHMELDLYKNDSSILFSAYRYLETFNGNTTTTVIAISSWSSIPSFKQLNSTHLVLIDYYFSCVKMLNRDNSNLQTVAGTCGSSGYVEGRVGIGMLDGPSGIEVDVRNPGKLLIIEKDNHALRSLDLLTGELSTVTTSGISVPRGIMWFKSKLLVANMNYISEVNWLNNGTITNERISVGDPSMTFYFPRELAKVGDGLYLVADFVHENLGLLNMKNMKVGPVCFKSEKACTKASKMTDNPMSLLSIGRDVLVGHGNAIYKLIGMNPPTPVKCPYSNITAYVEPSNMKAEVKLHSGTSAVLSLGDHQYKYYTDICSYYIHAIGSPVLRTVVFRSQYEVTCNSLNDKSTRDVLYSELSHKRGQLQEVCNQDCSLSKLKPWYTCDNDLLTVNWPTDKRYSMKWDEPPSSLNKLLRDRLSAADYISFAITIINHAPPVVPAKKDADGESIQIVLASSCADVNLTYNSDKDICV